MLQNRLDPIGNIILTKARGAWMGNRGILHDGQKSILRPFKLKAWITCVLEFKGRHRSVMAPNRYTELFSLDEATAFSAGHRPCAECRRADYNRFKECWIRGNPEYGFDSKISVKEIDTILHVQRIGAKGKKISFPERASNLPDGCFVLWDGTPHLLAGGLLYPWTAFGYGQPLKADGQDPLIVLTPASTVSAFRAGYTPQMAIAPTNVVETSPD